MTFRRSLPAIPIGPPARAALVAIVVLLAGCGQGSGDAAKQPGGANAPTRYAFSGGPPDEKDMQLLTASGSGEIGQIEQAIAAGGDVNAGDKLKRTPMFAAAFRNQPDVIRLLAGRGGNVNAKDALGLSPLHAAVVAGGLEAAQALLDSGADANMRGQGGETPLHLAAATDQVKMIELLLQHGANTRVRDTGGRTPIALAAANGHRAVVVAIRDWQAAHKNHD